mgnify:CR=1 FL=1
MLMGEYRHAMDAKGRLFMPAKLREDLGDKFIATQGIDGQLFVFSFEEWTNFANKLRSLPMSDPGAQAFVRLFVAGASECEVDKQGRVIIPQNLREHAGLTKDAVIIGNRSKVEIWSREAWEKYAEDNHSCEAFAETMAGLRI